LIATKKSLEVALADVYMHNHIQEIGLPFYPITADGTIAASKQYDTTLLLTVLHHADDPIKTLQEAKRLTKEDGRIIIIESVYGITDQTPFGKLSVEKQRLTNIFFDHFYNRVVHYSKNKEHKVNVPFNFSTAEGWRRIFESQGLEQIAYEALGIDQPIVPEYHTLHVLRKQGGSND
jgi:SAM-dependent methyltransferase